MFKGSSLKEKKMIKKKGGKSELRDNKKEERTWQRKIWVNSICFPSLEILKLCLIVDTTVIILSAVVLKRTG